MRPIRPRQGSSWPVVAFGAVALTVLAIAAFFLAGTQQRQREDLRDRYADRTVIASELLDSLFRVALGGQSAELSSALTGPDVSVAALDRRVAAANARWIVVVNASGQVLGASSAAPRALVQRLPSERYVRSALGADGYGLGNATRERELPTAVGFTAQGERRALVTNAPLATVGQFLEGALRPLPGVPEARSYVLDGNDRRLAASAQGLAVPAQTPRLIAALKRSPSGTLDNTEQGTRYYTSRLIRGSEWRLVVTVSEKALYASTYGISRAVPWIILGLTAIALLLVGLLLERLLRGARELGAANTELARSNADLEQFAYVASHDLSEPLRTVAGFSQLLGKRYRGRLDADADMYIEHMTDGVDRMQQLIDDLLLYSRVGRAPLSAAPVDLSTLLDEVLDDLAPAIGTRFARITRDPLPTVAGEQGQLRQALQNLVANAMKFTAPGVVPEVHVGASRDGESWVVTVADNGIGIAPEQREAIFKMFGRLHPSDAYPGTGIGLALVKRIVERHAGRIWVEPRVGGGSIFSFTLPARAPVPDPAPPREGAPA